MKRIIIIAMLGVSSFALGSPLPDFPFIFATGEAETNVAPNSAEMTFDITMFNEQSEIAVSELQNKSAEVSSLLLKLGLNSTSIVSYEIDKSAVREHKDFSEFKIIGYEVSQSFELKITDLSLYEKIAKSLFEMDFVVDIETDFERTDQKMIEAVLVSSACKDAKKQALLMASGMGQELGNVFSISQHGFDNIGAKFGLGSQSGFNDLMAMEQGFDWTQQKGKGEEFLFIPSTISFESSIAVIFKLKE